jgi:hypothetical protein
MSAFCLIFWGSFLFYTKSKYFPNSLKRIPNPTAKWIGTLTLLAATGLYIYLEGWASGLLLSVIAYSLAFGLLQLFAGLGRVYFYSLLAVIHLLLLIDLFSYAS